MITPTTDIYAEYLKMKAAHTRLKKTKELEAETLRHELEMTHNRYKKEIAKLRLELVTLKRESNPTKSYGNDARDIIQKAADFIGCKYEDMIGKWRLRDIVMARHIVFYFLRFDKGMKLNHIGALMNRDHATVIHGCKNAENYLNAPKWYPNEVALFNYLKNEQQ